MSADRGAAQALATQTQNVVTDGFVCPMHPDVRTSTPGACPRCGMKLIPASTESPAAYVLEAETTPAPLKAGRTQRLKLRVRHPATDATVQRFVEVHERIFHLFVIGQDLAHFEHTHPTLTADGSLEVDITLPRPGAYQLYTDFLPDGGTPQVLQRALLTAGFADDPERGRARLTPDLTEKTDGDISVAIQISAGEGLVAGRSEMFRMRLFDAQSRLPVKDLEPFLGAPAHALIVSEDLVDAAHSHPVEEYSRPTGPDIVFEAVFPRPGLYKLWTQFQRHGRVALVSFTLPVSEAP